MLIFQVLFLAYCLPLFAAYSALCFTVPHIRVGDVKKGKGYKLYVSKDMIHSDYLFESYMWRNEFVPKGKYIKIGWGDRKIFLETKSWLNLKVLDFLFAFFGLNKTVLRVDFLDDIPPGSTEIEIDKRQLEVLKIYVGESYNGRLIKKKPHFYQKGDFYESDLKYNCITNCNNWVNRGLFIARVTNRVWAPLSFWL